MNVGLRYCISQTILVTHLTVLTQRTRVSSLWSLNQISLLMLRLENLITPTKVYRRSTTTQ